MAELDESAREMLSIMQVDDDGDTFAQRAEMYYKRRPDLLRRLRLLRCSLHTLSSSLATTHGPVPLHHRSSFRSQTLDFATDPRKSTTTTTATEDSRSSSFSPVEEEVEEGGTIGEVARILGELARRNAEKREVKRELETKVERLERENEELKRQLEEEEEEEEGGRKIMPATTTTATKPRGVDHGRHRGDRDGVRTAAVDCSMCSGFVRRQRRSSRLHKIKQLIFREQ